MALDFSLADVLSGEDVEGVRSWRFPREAASFSSELELSDEGRATLRQVLGEPKRTLTVKAGGEEREFEVVSMTITDDGFTVTLKEPEGEQHVREDN